MVHEMLNLLQLHHIINLRESVCASHSLMQRSKKNMLKIKDCNDPMVISDYQMVNIVTWILYSPLKTTTTTFHGLGHLSHLFLQAILTGVIDFRHRHSAKLSPLQTTATKGEVANQTLGSKKKECSLVKNQFSIVQLKRSSHVCTIKACAWDIYING